MEKSKGTGKRHLKSWEQVREDSSPFSISVPQKQRTRIRPVFIPYAGCPHRCAFCAQPLQTGRAPQPLDSIYKETAEMLARAAREGEPAAELAFFGGTFTALPGAWPERFLELAADYRATGLVTALRCSTRPDAVDRDSLQRLKSCGLDAIELGVQSFDTATLAASQRGYTRETALRACALIKDAGLELGIQLMAGLPGHTQRAFSNDVQSACAAAPATVRLYPCLVLEGTELAATWRQGRYRPWGLNRSVAALAIALRAFEQRGIRVIRLGLAAEPGLAQHILAGPWHPALGNKVRALALFIDIREQIKLIGRPVQGLYYPRSRQGEIWGHARELVPAYARLGLSPGNARPWEESFCVLW